MCIQNFHVTNEALENRGQSVPSPSLTQRLCNSSAQTGTDSEVIQSCSRTDCSLIYSEFLQSQKENQNPLTRAMNLPPCHVQGSLAPKEQKGDLLALFSWSDTLFFLKGEDACEQKLLDCES